MTGPFGTTPGPWKADSDSDVVSPHGDLIAACYGYEADEEECNARAIAQVTAMLELIEAMVGGKPFTPMLWIEKAQQIARELEVK